MYKNLTVEESKELAVISAISLGPGGGVIAMLSYPSTSWRGPQGGVEWISIFEIQEKFSTIFEPICLDNMTEDEIVEKYFNGAYEKCAVPFTLAEKLMTKVY